MLGAIKIDAMLKNETSQVKLLSLNKSISLSNTIYLSLWRLCSMNIISFEVGKAYGHKMMTGVLRSKEINVNEGKVGKSLKRLQRHSEYEKKKQAVHWILNAIMLQITLDIKFTSIKMRSRKCLSNSCYGSRWIFRNGCSIYYYFG